MSGYQVQTQSKFGVSTMTSPFSMTDELQNEQIYDLQQFKENALGNMNSPDSDGGGYGGVFTLPASALNPTTPFELTIDQLCQSFVKLSSSTNTNAYSVDGGPTTGPFQTGNLKVYYVVATPMPFIEDDPSGILQWVELYQKIKGTYGFNQIPIGFPIIKWSLAVGRGTAIVLGYKSGNASLGQPYPGFDYYYCYVNQNDYAGAPLRYNLDVVSGLTSSRKVSQATAAGYTRIPDYAFTLQYYATEDLWFSTLFPEEYNTPASRCPKPQLRLPNQPWPAPL